MVLDHKCTHKFYTKRGLHVKKCKYEDCAHFCEYIDIMLTINISACTGEKYLEAHHSVHFFINYVCNTPTNAHIQ